MPASFRIRFSLREMTRLGPQLEGAVTKHASDNPALVAVVGALSATSTKLGSLARPGAPSVVDADLYRDELVRATATGFEYYGHRVDLPEHRAAAVRLQAALFPDGYAWVNAALGVESAAISKMLTAAAVPAVVADLAKLSMTDCMKALDHAQHSFLDVERGKGAAAGAGKDVTKDLRKLVARFNRKLDLYVSTVQDAYGEDPKEAARLNDLFQPLVDATGRERAQEAPPAGGATTPPTTK